MTRAISSMADPTLKAGQHRSSRKPKGAQKGSTLEMGRARKGSGPTVHISFASDDYKDIKSRADRLSVQLGFPVSPRMYIMHVLKFAPTVTVQEVDNQQD